MAKTSIYDLSDFVLEVIFDYLQSESLTLRSVCTHWNLLVSKYKTKDDVLFPGRRYDNIVRLFPQSQMKIRIRKSENVNRKDLTNVHALNLSYTKVSDVSKLGGVHTLDLCGTQVIDVSKLGAVHTLNLRGTQVTDVSALGSVHTDYAQII